MSSIHRFIGVYPTTAASTVTDWTTHGRPPMKLTRSMSSYLTVRWRRVQPDERKSIKFNRRVSSVAVAFMARVTCSRRAHDSSLSGAHQSTAAVEHPAFWCGGVFDSSKLVHQAAIVSVGRSTTPCLSRMNEWRSWISEDTMCHWPSCPLAADAKTKPVIQKVNDVWDGISSMDNDGFHDVSHTRPSESLNFIARYKYVLLTYLHRKVEMFISRYLVVFLMFVHSTSNLT